jgi:hypothetical protein
MAASRWSGERPKLALSALLVIVFATAAIGFMFANLEHVPREPIAVSRNFIELVFAGDLNGAYLLTDQGASVGHTLAEFESRIWKQLGIDASPTDRPVKLLGTRGGWQTYGNRLHRLLAGRKLDPDQLSVDYIAGPPFEVRLASDDRGYWRITYFQSHAM